MRIVSVEIKFVEDVVFSGGKVTTEPEYEKTYNKELAVKLDHEVYTILRETLRKKYGPVSK